MKDKQFDTIEWSGDFGYWQGSVPIDHFRDYGQAPYITAEADEEANSERFAIHIDTGGVRRVLAPQRLAWEKFLEAMPELGEQIPSALDAEYQLQRPARVKWWKAVYGEASFDAALPEANGPELMKKMVRPTLFHLPAPDKDSPGRIGIMFQCCWNKDGCSAVVSEGALSSVGIAGATVSPKPISRLTHATLGNLRMLYKNQPWIGTVRAEPFREFCSVAQARAAYRENPTGAGRQRSDVNWGFARGDFLMWVHARPGEVPSENQGRALEAFKADETRTCQIVLQGVFEHYQQTYEQRRSDCRGREPYPEEALPEIASPAGLREIMNLVEIDILPEAGDGTAILSFVFSIAGGGVGIRWCNGEIVGLARKDGTAVEEYLKGRRL